MPKAQGGVLIIEILSHFNFAHPQHCHFCFREEGRLNLVWLGTWRMMERQGEFSRRPSTM